MGTRRVRYKSGVGPIMTDKTVADVHRPIWSVGAILEKGGSMHFTQDRSWIETPNQSSMDLIRHNR
eukprot:10690877-Alexandrium_andersonii.AAC.1